jgi:hypothetical protein
LTLTTSTSFVRFEVALADDSGDLFRREWRFASRDPPSGDHRPADVLPLHGCRIPVQKQAEGGVGKPLGIGMRGVSRRLAELAQQHG